MLFFECFKMASSFKKKSNRGRSIYPCGTKVSLHNNQLLISTGIPSFDTIIGGGVAVGSALLLEEDKFGTFAKTLLTCFLAEGALSNHSLYFASATMKPNDIWKNLPCPINEPTNTSYNDDKQNDMKIAWRYQNMPSVQSSSTFQTTFGHFFDFTKSMNAEKMDQVTKFEWNAGDFWCHNNDTTLTDSKSLLSPLYCRLLKDIQNVIKNHNFFTSVKEVQNRSILRIVLHSMHSSLWTTSDQSFLVFLYHLKALLRSSYAVCFIAIPQYLQNQDSNFLSRVERFCDTVVQLESFSGSVKETNPLYKDYHGLFHIVKLPRLNTLTCHMPESLNLAFKHRRKKFIIEKLHLPPDISDESSHHKQTTLQSCGTSSGTNKLDF